MTRPVPLTIVTSASHGYAARWLDEWAGGLLALDRVPEGGAVVVTHGPEADGDHAAGARAVARLTAAGWPARHRAYPGPALNVGRGRNLAVAEAATEWVMHLDADDVIMPHALAEFDRLRAGADIVAFGYERFGDLRAGPRRRRATYRDLPNGDAVLRSTAPCSGVSPFRRAFWAQAPYPEDVAGGWDTFLWRGFGWLGARVKATPGPVFRYRQHADSVFNRRRLDHVAAAPVGDRLRSAATAPGAVIIPWRDTGDPDRAAALEYMRAWWAAALPRWRVMVAPDPDPRGPWRKGLAINRGLVMAEGELAIVADGDCLPERDALDWCVRAVRAQRVAWAMPHDRVRRLTRAASARVMGGQAPGPDLKLLNPEYVATPAGGILVARRWALLGTGGAPVAFTGWGLEDEAWSLALDTLLGPVAKRRAPLWHLYHGPGPRHRHPDFPRNAALLRAFKGAHGDRAAMAELAMGVTPPTTPNHNGEVPMSRNVRMVALQSFAGSEAFIKKGATFWATEAEARFYTDPRRNRALAARVTPEGYLTKLGVGATPPEAPPEAARADAEPTVGARRLAGPLEDPETPDEDGDDEDGGVITTPGAEEPDDDDDDEDDDEEEEELPKWPRKITPAQYLERHPDADLATLAARYVEAGRGDG